MAELGRFTGPLILQDGKHKWTVMRGFTFVRANGERIVVPKGFATDLASIPQMLQGLVSKVHFSYNQPAALHDWLYHLSRIGRPLGDRKHADRIFREGILAKEAEAGMDYSVADAMYHAVRVGAWGSWGKRLTAPANPLSDPFHDVLA